MKIMNTLAESHFLNSTSSYKKFTAKQIAELVYLHVLALRIIASEPYGAHYAMDYATRSTRYMGFAKWYSNATDLHLLIHALIDENVDLKMPESSQEFKETLYFDEIEMRTWMKDIAHGHINETRTKRLFMHLDGQLQIKNSSMKAVRRLVQDWDHNTQKQKQLSMTRLLQMMRLRSRQSDLLIELEKIAAKAQLELHNVNNEETGDVAHHDGSDPRHTTHQVSGEPKFATRGFLKGLAQIAGGAVLGYTAINHISESEEQLGIVVNPDLPKILDMLQTGMGLTAVMEDKNLYISSKMSHERIISEMNLKNEPTTVLMHLYATYIKLVVIQPVGSKKEQALSWGNQIYEHAALSKLYPTPLKILVTWKGEPGFDRLMELLEDVDGGTCAADIATFVKPLSLDIQKRPSPVGKSSKAKSGKKKSFFPAK